MDIAAMISGFFGFIAIIDIWDKLDRGRPVPVGMYVIAGVLLAVAVILAIADRLASRRE